MYSLLTPEELKIYTNITYILNYQKVPKFDLMFDKIITKKEYDPYRGPIRDADEYTEDIEKVVLAVKNHTNGPKYYYIYLELYEQDQLRQMAVIHEYNSFAELLKNGPAIIKEYFPGLYKSPGDL